MLGVALDRDHVDRLGLVCMHVDGKPEVGWKIAADFAPGVAGVVTAHDVPMLLHEHHAGARGVHRDAVDAVADLGRRLGNVLRPQAAVYRPPALAGIIAPERAGGRDGDEDPIRIGGVEQDRVQAHAAGARLPLGPEG